MIISVKRNFLELKNINELIKKNKPEDNYFIEKTKPDFQLNKFFYNPYYNTSIQNPSKSHQLKQKNQNIIIIKIYFII